MNFTQALEAMASGKKVKLPEWQGYWFMRGVEVKVFSSNGDILDTPWFDKYDMRTDFEECTGNGTLGFDFALRSLQNGKHVARSGWNGKNMYLFLIGTNPQQPGIGGWTFTNGKNDNYDIAPFIAMKTADDKIVPWLASQTDILSHDWSVIV